MTILSIWRTRGDSGRGAARPYRSDSASKGRSLALRKIVHLRILSRLSGYVIMTNGENSGYYGVIAKLTTGEILSRFLGGKLPDNPA